MRMLLTGSNGFVGGHIAAAARRRGWTVLGLGRQPAPATAVDQYVRHDLGEPLTLNEAVDVVVHCAALASPWAPPEAYQRANVDATRNVLDWAEGHGTPPVHFVSSSSVFYTAADQLNLTEQSPIPAPADQLNAYSRTKLAGERLVGYDNERGKGDHRHYGDREEVYAFTSVEQLAADFEADVAKLRGDKT